jgi:peptide-methionine (R)-S-oxide reductase
MRPVEAANVLENIDRSHGIARIVVRSKQATFTCARVFPDGPSDKGGP